jgi:hypothetical protein
MLGPTGTENNKNGVFKIFSSAAWRLHAELWTLASEHGTGHVPRRSA